jgi:hypothetical protein
LDRITGSDRTDGKELLAKRREERDDKKATITGCEE